MNNLYILSFILFLFQSCSNDINYTGTYKASSYLHDSKRLYTRNGELTNTAVYNSFISRHHTDLNVYYGSFETIMLEPAKIQFVSLTEAKYIFVYNNTVLVTKNGNLLCLEEKDTTNYSDSCYTYPPTEEPIYKNMLSYHENYMDTVRVSDYPITYIIKIKRCHYFVQDGSNLLMPMMSYWYFKPDSVKSSAFINNVFNISSVNQLGERDTLVVEESRIVFK